MITTAKQYVIAEARSKQHPTSEAQIEKFAANLRLSSVVKPCPVHQELYGSVVPVLDLEKLARTWLASNMGRGFDSAVTMVEERVEALHYVR